ncbi:hypothetical protein HRG_000207 [Hirsutella rhossiliensis]|uniref:Up-regulated in Daf-2 domain-containing protein n=1 Tax=Hirsutella rhossiliensis TaxID=111463 RepID=A0A9P8SN69_9HYPO|nr:uncharacterized protein HRG_00207 [Hirsutella rhossiliensis]KAH0967565.1 hypothetical protein HRG_00207 [Hirsutella rhossiliensis]
MEKRMIFAVLLTLLEIATAQLRVRKASVSVRNNTPRPLQEVSVVHKYSSVYKHNHTWPIIQPGERAEDRMVVQYHTGFGTIGVDWWAITWVELEQKTSYVSKPLNFRKIVDYMEKFAPRTISALASTAAGIATVEAGPGAMVAAAVAAAVASQQVTEFLFSSESTDGFKQHMLEREDQNTLTEIVIEADGTIAFKSNSGNSYTVSEALTPAPEPKQVDMSREDQSLNDAAHRVMELRDTAPDSQELEYADLKFQESMESWLQEWRGQNW